MRRSQVGITLMAVGALVILWGVFELTGAGYGTDVRRDFAERRSYNMVKRDVHEALPWAAAKGLAGLGVLLLGAKLRSRRAQ